MTSAAATKTASRHQGREVALQVLYAIDLGGQAGMHRPPLDEAGDDEPTRAEASAEEGGASVSGGPTVALGDRAFERVIEHFSVPGGALEFARELVRGVVAALPDLDALVSLHARNWRVARMAVVDRNVLRIGAFELCKTDTPVAVVIDEGIDLARRFGSDSSPSFVNGVLDAIAKEVRSA
ncbi:MAG: transcription antitermination factor NusB [Myxococcota bacterium]